PLVDGFPGSPERRPRRVLQAPRSSWHGVQHPRRSGVVLAHRQWHLVVVLLLRLRDEPPELLAPKDLQPEARRVALADILDEVDEEVLVPARLLDLPRLYPEEAGLPGAPAARL